jgi:mannose-6-phosphate isomerase
VYKGLKPGTTKEMFLQGIKQGHCERLLNSVPVKAGDCFYLPSGTVHAVGKGILAAEVQTPSDTTFRVYDFHRIDKSTGRLRKLHVEQAMECIHFGDEAPTPAPDMGAPLVQCEFFEMDEVRFAGKTQRGIPTGRPVIWMVLEGQLSVKVNNLPTAEKFRKGDTVLLPAAMSNPVLSTEGACRWLEIKFPH